MKTTTKIALVAAMTFTAAPALHAQQEAQDQGQTAEVSPEQRENVLRAARILRAFTVAVQSEEVQQAVKGKLLSCMYNNKLATIAQATGQVFANNPQLSYEKPGDLYRAAAGVCGVSFRPISADQDAGR